MQQTQPSLTSADIAKALAIYCSIAYDGKTPPVPPPAIDESAPLSATLAAFIDESRRKGTSGECARFVLRLGNTRYPHMKFVVERFMGGDQYYFSADTHDQAKTSVIALGQTEWKTLQDSNRKYKMEIEQAWYTAGLPTLRTVKERAHFSQRTAPAGAHILIVDDEPDAVHLLGIALTREGYRVATSCCGREAIDKAKSSKPDLVLLDYMMPEMSGREVCAELKHDQATCNIPVVIATYADVDQESLDLADDVLKKPFNTKELVERVNQLLRHHCRP
ncbi:MAG: response regulator [Nitrospira sp.]|nr:response regulator [Planctomycetota bacterium]MCK6500353.1 response regulator [Nitrospira sp.]NUQ33904.1 response regulator [Planctomycetaceae bacterium]